MVYVDSSKPDMVEGFTKKTFTAMIQGVRNGAIEACSSPPYSMTAPEDCIEHAKRTAFFAIHNLRA